MSYNTIDFDSVSSLIRLAIASQNSWIAPKRADAEEAAANPGLLFWEGKDGGAYDDFNHRLYSPLSLHCCDDNGTVITVKFAESTVRDAFDILSEVVATISAVTNL